MSQFPVTSSQLSASHIAAYLQSHYSIGADVQCRIIKAGINDTYSVSSSAGKFVFRVYSLDWRSREEIQEELRLTEYLKAQGISVSYPIADKAQQFIHELDAPEGLRYAVLFSYAAGQKLYSYDAATHYKVGRIMAQIHQATDGLALKRATYTVSNMVTEPLEDIRQFLPADSPEMNFMDRAAQYLQAEFAKVDETALRRGAVHMDIWFDNLNIDAEGNISIFDFDFCGNGWLCLDIAYYILQLHSIEKDEKECKEKVDSFLAGYKSLLDISAEEQRIIPMLGVALYFFYLGTQCRRYDNWSNVFLNEAHLKRYINLLVKRYAEINKLPV